MSKEAMKLALEALNSFPHRHLTPLVSDARTALREALAQPQQEPLAWANPNDLQNFDLKVRTNAGPLHTVPLYTSPPAQPQQEPVPPVDGDLLPPVGSKVLIHLASQDEWVEHAVVGYYVWGAFDSDNLHRVFVRVRNSDCILNARRLCDVRAIEAAHGIKGDA